MIYILIVIVFAASEYLIKNYIEADFKKGENKDILKGKITISKHHNTGAVLSFLENKKEIVKIASSICLGFILLLFTLALPKKGNKVYKLGLSLVLGGAISNVADRFLRGYVVDYFSINYKKLKNIVFNLADIAIFIGTLFIFLSTVFSTKGKSSSNKTTE